MQYFDHQPCNVVAARHVCRYQFVARLHCRFRDIVAKLKSMAQVLRPPPKRRPSQITTQASAASSQPSSRNPSYPNSVQLPNIKECAALAEQAAAPALTVPKANDSTPAVGAATDAGASTPKTQASADIAAVDAGASPPKTQASTEQGSAGVGASTEASEDQVTDAGASTPKADATAKRVTPDTAAAGASDAGQQYAEKTSGLAAASSQTSTEQQATQEGAGKPCGDKPQKDEYVSPFEQAQEPAAASTQRLSPFANIS